MIQEGFEIRIEMLCELSGVYILKEVFYEVLFDELILFEQRREVLIELELIGAFYIQYVVESDLVHIRNTFNSACLCGTIYESIL